MFSSSKWIWSTTKEHHQRHVNPKYLLNFICLCGEPNSLYEIPKVVFGYASERYCLCEDCTLTTDSNQSIYTIKLNFLFV